VFLILAAEAAPRPGTPIWVTFAVAFITVLGGGLGWNIWKRLTHGKTEDAIQVSQAAIEQARGAKDLFVEYRVELEAAQRQIATYLDQLIQVNRMLGESNARIASLEIELKAAKSEHVELSAQLRAAQRDKEVADQTREHILRQMETLQDQIHRLESGASGVNYRQDNMDIRQDKMDTQIYDLEEDERR
jgi:chromosome segregation ATPase